MPLQAGLSAKPLWGLHRVTGASRAARRKAWRASSQRRRQDLPQQEVALVAFTFILDDIVYPDGSSSMQNPGGGGVQTLFSYQLYHRQQQQVGLAAGVGPDLPPACTQWLTGCGVRLDGLLQHSHPTPRAWQVLEEDGRRAEIWRTLIPLKELAAMLRPPLGALPPALRAPSAFHVAVNPSDPGLEHLQQLRAAVPDGLLSVETFTTAAAPLAKEELQQLASLCDIFSPNEGEVISMLGPLAAAAATAAQPGSQGSRQGDGALLQLTEPFLEAGAQVVAVRRGPHGAVVHSRAEGAWDIPAVAGTKVVDVTGCGNAFCGALLAALQAGEALQVAGAWGCVAGSLMAEWRGVPQATPAELHSEASRRLGELLPHVRRLA